MRPRTFILLILVLLAGAAVVVLLVARNSDSGLLANLLGNEDQPATSSEDETADTPDTEDNGDGVDSGADDIFLPTPTPSLQSVVVAKVRLPVGEMITEDLLVEEMRPSDNIAIQGGYVFTSTESLLSSYPDGAFPRIEIARGQEILAPMIAEDATDVANLGSDLSLMVGDPGNVAVAFPVNRFTGAAFAMRPGDLVDVIMTVRIIETDPVFGTALPNEVKRVIQSALLSGQEFLFPPIADGRLEFVPEINQVAAIVPSTLELDGQDFEAGRPIPKRVTQLTVQTAEVLYIGTYFDRKAAEQLLDDVVAAELEELLLAAENAEEPLTETLEVESDPLDYRIDPRPDVVILSLPAQDALTLKWALERGVDLDLALRSPVDVGRTFTTSSVSLPQLLDQGQLAFPEQYNYDLFPSVTEVPRPGLAPESILIDVSVSGSPIVVSPDIQILENPIEEEAGTP